MSARAAPTAAAQVFLTIIHLLYLGQSSALCFKIELFAWVISYPEKVRFLCGHLILANVICLLSVLPVVIVHDQI